MHFRQLLFLPLALGFILTSRATICAQTSWEKVSTNLFDKNFEVLTADPNGKALFLASDKNLYRTSNGGAEWENIFSLKGNGHLNFIQPDKTKRLFLLSTDGVFKSDDGGKNWRKIFSAIGKAPTNALALSHHPQDEEVMFLGTAQGLYWSLDGGESWVDQGGAFSHEKVRSILHHPTQENVLFAATDENFYRSGDSGKSFEKTFHVSRNLKEEIPVSHEEGILDEDNTGERDLFSISAVKVCPINPREILLGTSNGVFVSENLGQSWRALTKIGLGNTRVKDLEISSKDGTIFISTERGVYIMRPNQNRWIEIYDGLPEKSIRSLKLVQEESRETLFAVVSDNVFKWRHEWIPFPEIPKPDYPVSNEDEIKELKNIFEREPSVREIQKATIRYADVTNGKIKRWHLASRLKAFVPDLSMGKDISVRNNIDIDRAGTTQPDVFIAGPDSYSRGKDISLNWKLSSIIFSSDQTSIDSREKLMVELRSDVLSEATRLYFERRRLLMELYLNRPETNKDYLEHLLRIDELTAYLDGLTGGYLSKELRKRKITYY